jgi:hypothetical protein
MKPESSAYVAWAPASPDVLDADAHVALARVSAVTTVFVLRSSPRSEMALRDLLEGRTSQS